MNQQKMQGQMFTGGALVDGTAQVRSMAGAPLPATVWAKPVAGDTVTISYSTDDGVSFNAWPAAGVTAYTADVLESGVTHIKAQRTAGAGTTSTWGVC